MSQRGRSALVSGLVLAGLAAAIWLLVAVVRPVAEEAECAEVELRAGPEVEPDDPARRPPLRGGGGLAHEIRIALRGDGAAVFCRDFADPFVLRVGDTFYSYSTNTDDHHVPVLVSGGIFETGDYRDALPELPAWTEPGYVWSPGVLATDDAYVLYYSTFVEPGRECISVAVADDPAGPFVDDSDGPFACPDGGGAIDPYPFRTGDGRVYLAWKEYGPDRDGIVVQEATADGLGLVGPSELVLEVTEDWEGRIVEAPSMIEHDGTLYLFYSGNEWQSAFYAIGYALCETPLGPCTKPFPAPWLASTEAAQGPGGQAIFDDEDGRLWMVVHAWVSDRIGYPDGARNLFVVRLDFHEGLPIAG